MKLTIHTKITLFITTVFTAIGMLTLANAETPVSKDLTLTGYLSKLGRSFIAMGELRDAPDLLVHKRLLVKVNSARSILNIYRSELGSVTYEMMKTRLEAVNTKLGRYHFYLVTPHYINLQNARYWKESAVNDVKGYMEYLYE